MKEIERKAREYATLPMDVGDGKICFDKKVERAFIEGGDALVKTIWHKESDHPNNKHPYPVINPDGEMAFAYYDGIYGWQFDRDFPHSVNMMWLDIEMILPARD